MCYCGDKLFLEAYVTYGVSRDHCNTKCFGNGGQNCGSYGYLDVYKRGKKIITFSIKLKLPT